MIDTNKQSKSTINKDRVVSLFKDSPETLAVYSKLTTGEKDNRKLKSGFNNGAGKGYINKVSKDSALKNKDNKDILKLFPDLSLAADIVVSMALAPKDLDAASLNYSSLNTDVPSTVSAPLIKSITKELEGNYNFSESLHDILHKALFDTGSTIKIVIPENSLDTIINRGLLPSNESVDMVHLSQINKELGILGKVDVVKNGISTESIEADSKKANAKKANAFITGIDQIDNMLTVTDNFNVLKMPDVHRSVSTENIKTCIYGSSNKADDDKVLDLLDVFKKTAKSLKSTEVVPNNNENIRRTIGAPLILDAPSESIVPAHVPGDPTNHIGYFALINSKGYLVTAEDGLKTDKTLAAINSSVVGKSIIDKANAGLNLKIEDNTSSKDVIGLFSDLVEMNLVKRITNGMFSGSVALSENKMFYNLMLSRSLESKGTTLLYIPEELVSYIAINYRSNGTGKSLLEDLAMLNSIRAALLFSGVVSDIKNNIPNTVVDLELDERDPNPMKTIEAAENAVLKTQQAAFPAGMSSIPDLVDWTHKQGITFTFSGHPDVPNTKLTFDQGAGNRHSPTESDLSDNIRKQVLMGMGVSPEIVDNGFSGDFASTDEANRLLMSKRILATQKAFMKHMTKFAKTICRSDGNMQNTLREIIESNKSDLFKAFPESKALYKKSKELFLEQFLDIFINSLSLSLPAPDTNSNTILYEDFSNYESALTEVLESAWMTDAMADSELFGEIADTTDGIKELVKAYYLREWCTENNFMLELFALTETDINDNPIVDLGKIMEGHAAGLNKTVMSFLKEATKKKRKSDKTVEKITGEEEEEIEEAPNDADGEEETTLDDDGLDDADGEEETTLDDDGLGDAVEV